MTPEEQATLETFRAMSDALEMVEAALAIARQGLDADPSKQERRQLDEDLRDLALKRTRLTSAMIALSRGQGTTDPLTPEQIAEIKALAGQVDQLTQQSIAASGAVVATGNVLDLLAKAGLG
jgi:hypothetical protein